MVDIQETQSLPKKQQQLIDAATELFCKHGMRRVTVEEICKKAGISKMTFYKYFTDKNDIGRAVLDCLINAGLEMYYEMISEPVSFAQKVEKILMLSTSQIHALGAAFLDDLMNPEAHLHAYFLEQQKKVRGLSIEFLQQAQQEGLISSEVKIPVMMFFLNSLSELLNHPDFVRILPDIEARACELSALFFHGCARTSQ
jgi:AcrR family transcriptional regulator